MNSPQNATLRASIGELQQKFILAHEATLNLGVSSKEIDETLKKAQAELEQMLRAVEAIEFKEAANHGRRVIELANECEARQRGIAVTLFERYELAKEQDKVDLDASSFHKSWALCSSADELEQNINANSFQTLYVKLGALRVLKHYGEILTLLG